MAAQRYVFILFCFCSGWLFAHTDTIPIQPNNPIFKVNQFSGFDDADIAPDDNYPYESLKNLIHINILGIADSIGAKARIDAVVYSKNFASQGTQIHIVDKDTIGIIAVHSTTDFGYNPNLGDQITLLGSVHQSMGQLFFRVDTLWKRTPVVATLVSPQIVTTLNESYENNYVRLKGLQLQSPAQWQKGNPNGFCVDVSNGKEFFKIYFSPKSGLTELNAPFGKFSISGFVYQQDTLEPLFQHYYIVPLSNSDLILERDYKELSIPQVKINNSIGEPIELGKFVSISGWVQSPNYLSKKGGVKCLITDSTGVGILILQQKSSLYKTIQLNDYLTIKGKVVQVSGNTTLLADTIEKGNKTLSIPPSPAVIDYISEACEDNISKFSHRFWLSNFSEWVSKSPYFEVRANDSKNEITLRIYEESEWFKLLPPQGSFMLTGYAEQEDETPPYFQNYYFVVRYKSDIDLSNSTVDIPIQESYAKPNPFLDELYFSIDQQNSPFLTIKDLWGKTVWQRNQNSSLSSLPSGNYILNWSKDGYLYSQKLVKIGN